MRPSYGAPEVEKEGSRTSGVLEKYHEGLRNISGVCFVSWYARWNVYVNVQMDHFSVLHCVSSVAYNTRLAL